MQRILAGLLLFFVSIQGATLLHFRQGWQLIGTPEAIEDLSVFEDPVEIIWAFDSAQQRWKGYSPDGSLSEKMAEAGVEPLQRLNAFEAFWIKSSRAWDLSLPDTSQETPTADAALLQLQKGWNLVSLPDNAVIDPALFDGMTLWKYDGQWETNRDGDLPFPKTETIRTGEGFWLYSDSRRSIDIPEASSALHTFRDKTQMEDFIRKMAWQNRIVYDGYIEWPMLVANDDYSGETDFSEDSGGASDTTTTNVQEEGVDESDILKHDGTHLFFYDRHADTIHVYTFDDIAAGRTEPLTDIETRADVQAMYLSEGRLAVVTYEMRYYIMASETRIAEIMPPVYDPPVFTLHIYDVSNVRDIKTVSETTIEGTYVDSRLKDGTLYLVSSFTPQVVYEYPVIYPETNCSLIVAEMQNPETGVCDSTGLCTAVETDSKLESLYVSGECYRYNYDSNGTAWLYDYDHPIVQSEHLIPRIGKEDYVTASRLYAPYKLDQEYAITSIGAFDIGTGELRRNISYIGSASTRYASAGALYLAAASYPRYYDLERYTERTALYKFALDDNLSYRGRGFVDGHLLSQYSLSEYDGTLRVAATEGFSWSAEGTDNAVYTLTEKEGALQLTGSLKGLGEAGEQIRAVRFLGDKGFVVTFRQTDPFYTLDLSDPAAPKAVGELKISGFSEYLHPVDENRILSIGRDADAEGRVLGLQVQLFDISDFAHPRLADKITIGDRYTYSEAEHNPRAFAYRASDGLFGFPLYRYSQDLCDVGFDIYQIDGFSLRHRMLLNEPAQSSWYTYEGRGVIFDLGGTTYGALFKGARAFSRPLEGE